MSIPTIDKVTLTNIVAALVIVVYLTFRLVYPTQSIPQDLSTYVAVAFGWFFVVGGVAYGQRIQKTQ